MLNLDTEHELYALSEEECLEEEPVPRSSRPKSGKSKLVSPVTSRSIGRTWGEHLGGKFCVGV